MNASKKLNVLVVEDGLANRRLAVALLSKWGYQVEVAHDGQQAIEKCTKPHGFDLILMDLQMPTMDGYEATKVIRSSEEPGEARTPIIAMTAEDSELDREKCLLADMDGYLAKPIRQQDLQEAMEQYHSSVSDAKCLIDWTAAIENFDHDANIMSQVLSASLEELPDLMTQIERQFAGNDRSDLQRLAHTIKASARAFPSAAVLRLALAVEFAASNEDWTLAEAKYNALKPLLDRFMDELKAHR